MKSESVEYDVAIIGSGPAGLQAAVHSARRKVAVAVIGKLKKSSLSKYYLENYCCMDSKMAGDDFLENGKRQAERAGAIFHQEDVLEISRGDDQRFRLAMESGKVLIAKALILAMGISRNRLGKPGEREFLGKGVSYCVDCDGGFYKKQKVAVVGNESAAASGALTMLLIAEEVHLIYKESHIDETLKTQVDHSDIVTHPGRWVKAIEGDGGVERLILDNDEILEVSGVFIELGAKGALELAATLGVALDPEKFQYIVTDKTQSTNVPGIFAAGDICGPPWQVAKAVGEGCVAGLEAATYSKKLET